MRFKHLKISEEMSSLEKEMFLFFNYVVIDILIILKCLTVYEITFDCKYVCKIMDYQFLINYKGDQR